MRAALRKAMRWWFIAMAVTIGSTAFMIAEETGSMRPVIFGILGYGVGYVIAALWKDMRGRPVAWGIGVYIAIALGSSYVNDLLFVLFDYEGVINKYFLWMVVLTVVGIPIMTMVFRRSR